MKKDRAKIIDKAMRMVWSSLESHLLYTHQKKFNPEGRGFHKRCVREYAILIELLSHLY